MKRKNLKPISIQFQSTMFSFLPSASKHFHHHVVKKIYGNRVTSLVSNRIRFLEQKRFGIFRVRSEIPAMNDLEFSNARTSAGLCNSTVVQSLWQQEIH